MSINYISRSIFKTVFHLCSIASIALASTLSAMHADRSAEQTDAPELVKMPEGLIRTSQRVREGLRICSIVPLSASQGWQLELFELKGAIPVHYHKVQKQIILSAGAPIQAVLDEQPSVLNSSQYVVIEPGVTHSLRSDETSTFFVIDFPGFIYPEDVYEDQPVGVSAWDPSSIFPHNPPIAVDFFGEGIHQETLSVYPLGTAPDGSWGVDLLEIKDSPKHFHKIGTEVFTVVKGTLEIEVDGTPQILAVGETISIKPYSVHQLKSAGPEAVRVLAFNYPAFSQEDFYLSE